MKLQGLCGCLAGLSRGMQNQQSCHIYIAKMFDLVVGFSDKEHRLRA